MDNNNMMFFEEYTKTEKICSEIFNEKNGVTSYIEEMGKVSSSVSGKISLWDDDLKRLKDYRHLRNMLAHGEISFDSSFCDEEDVKWIKDFRESIMNCTDPLAKVRKINEHSEGKVRNTEPQHPTSYDKNNIYTNTYSKAQNDVAQNNNYQSLKNQPKKQKVNYAELYKLYISFLLLSVGVVALIILIINIFR